MIKAIVFDVDDLMVNSAPLHTEASRRVFEPLGVDVRGIPDDIVATFFGKRVFEIVRIIAKYFGIEKSVDLVELTKERERVFLEIVERDLVPMPGLFELVREIKKVDLKRAIASSGIKVYIDTVLKKFSLTDFFDVIVSGDMVRNGKPDPEVFLKAASLLRVEPFQCLVLEDATAGVLAAKAAGMYCIGVDNSLSKYKQDLSKADRVVSRLDHVDPRLFSRI